MNNIFLLVGRITKDLKLRYTKDNKAVVDLPLAIQNGKDDTTFITIGVFGAIAETTSKYCHKGDLVGVSGMIKNHNWTDSKDIKHYDYTFLANKITFLQTKKEDKQEIPEDIPQNIKSQYDGIKLTDEEIDKTFDNDNSMELPF